MERRGEETHLLALEDVDELELLLEGREEFKLDKAKPKVGIREQERTVKDNRVETISLEFKKQNLKDREDKIFPQKRPAGGS